MSKKSSRPDLGPCCVCNGARGAVNIVSLYRWAPVPGQGWGCPACALDRDGALSVVCEKCWARYGFGAVFLISEVCYGPLLAGERVPLAECVPGFDHLRVNDPNCIPVIAWK